MKKITVTLLGIFLLLTLCMPISALGQGDASGDAGTGTTPNTEITVQPEKIGMIEGLENEIKAEAQQKDGIKEVVATTSKTVITDAKAPEVSGNYTKTAVAVEATITAEVTFGNNEKNANYR